LEEGIMPYFPPESDADNEYWCPNCRMRYRVPRVRASCCVLHSPGSCCHYGETKVEPGVGE
jgi:hypothetical protein